MALQKSTLLTYSRNRDDVDLGGRRSRTKETVAPPIAPLGRRTMVWSATYCSTGTRCRRQATAAGQLDRRRCRYGRRGRYKRPSSDSMAVAMAEEPSQPEGWFSSFQTTCRCNAARCLRAADILRRIYAPWGLILPSSDVQRRRRCALTEPSVDVP